MISYYFMCDFGHITQPYLHSRYCLREACIIETEFSIGASDGFFFNGLTTASLNACGM